MRRILRAQRVVNRKIKEVNEFHYKKCLKNFLIHFILFITLVIFMLPFFWATFRLYCYSIERAELVYSYNNHWNQEGIIDYYDLEEEIHEYVNSNIFAYTIYNMRVYYPIKFLFFYLLILLYFWIIVQFFRYNRRILCEERKWKIRKWKRLLY